MNRNIENRLNALEERIQPMDSRRLPVCYVFAGEDKDEVLARYKKEHDVKEGERVHVVMFVTPEMVRAEEATKRAVKQINEAGE